MPAAQEAGRITRVQNDDRSVQVRKILNHQRKNSDQRFHIKGEPILMGSDGRGQAREENRGATAVVQRLGGLRVKWQPKPRGVRENKNTSTQLG